MILLRSGIEANAWLYLAQLVVLVIPVFIHQQKTDVCKPRRHRIIHQNLGLKMKDTYVKK